MKAALAAVLLLACSPPAKQNPPSNTAVQSGHVQRGTDEDALVALILERFFADATTLPDAGVLPRTGPIYLLAATTEEPPRRINPAAVPSTGARVLVLKTQAELQQQAETTQQPVAFVYFGGISVTGDSATVAYGVDITLPTNPNTIKLCCCSQSLRFVKRRGRWMVDPHARRVVSCS